MAVDVRPLVDMEQGVLSPRVYCDEDIFQLELERLFGRCWLFLAHDTMIPKPGDFMTTYMGEDPVIIARQKDGSVAAFLNQCRHRGMRLCRVDGGTNKVFTCTYHGWGYDLAGNLINVPHEEQFPGMDRTEWGAIKVPRLENYHGFIFGSWDRSIPPFTEYLGDMAWYMDVFVNRFEGGLEAIGGVHKWVIDCNWKFAAEQFTSDMSHAEISHGSAFIACMPDDYDAARGTMPEYGVQFSSELGHGCGFFLEGPVLEFTPGVRIADYWERETLEHARGRLGDIRAEGFRAAHMNVFPTFSFLPGIQTTRVWHPRGPNQIEVWAWVMVPRNAPDEVKEAWRIGTMRTFSPAGHFEQDDGENWVEIQKTLRGAMARRTRLNVQMGMGGERLDADGFPGKTNICYAEMAARGFYQRWSDVLTMDTWAEIDAARVRRGDALRRRLVPLNGAGAGAGR